MSELKITQADRDAAASYGRSVGILTRQEAAQMMGGGNDDCTVVQAFARHRIAAEEGQAELVEAAFAMAQYLRETPHHNATQAAALRAALARVRGEG